ncbi:hypothetical protein CCYS_00370 [Corynebacterium cystitidis DSM 20524]|uniref:Uncharacterized protein n=1 Tax=Corynebacterium cystitidis DSM 20524 TaxID=1121357 RepID=A0A1H9UNM2_9CORY|nr:hypothetical protein CCYS_00370 [Corynebacterium cystitidis DSM 20524]SES11066.1 hypothetical protein SAMN05661109_01901 [Corynebacterium cystitidis DSM 20524]SNV90344.1 Uncharacterised protein [Corynebacterium cystitidis]
MHTPCPLCAWGPISFLDNLNRPSRWRFLGRPIFLDNDSVQRQGKAILDISELKGIYGGAPEFAQARHEAEEAVRDKCPATM